MFGYYACEDTNVNLNDNDLYSVFMIKLILEGLEQINLHIRFLLNYKKA